MKGDLRREPAQPVQYGFRFNQSRCNGCKTCDVACKDYHGLDGGVSLRTIYEITGGTWRQDDQGAWTQDVFSYHLSMSCNHCSNPICLRFCSSNAVVKDDSGFVTIDQDACVGCQTCMVTCPYHAPRFDERSGRVVKCDGCKERVLAGEQPICVEACPQRALEFGLYEDLVDDYCIVSSVGPLPSPGLTQPNFAIVPCVTADDGMRPGQTLSVREA